MLEQSDSIVLNLPSDLVSEASVAVGVSGGSDSMALAFLMAQWARDNGVALHVLSVDHGLRVTARNEVEHVASTIGAWKEAWGGALLEHHILTYDGQWSESAIQEQARYVRYNLMAAFCLELGVSSLCLAHHEDDQGETFLFRLAKGSGLDGLCAMNPVADYSPDLRLVRPMLDVSKADLVSFCDTQGIVYIDDPGNENHDFARVRLRAARDVLAAEGLSNKRLALSAKRLQRAQKALECAADRLYVRAVDLHQDSVNVDVLMLRAEPEEVAFRVMLRVVRDLRIGAAYLPRMERLENLFADFWARDDSAFATFRKRTLGGLVFEIIESGRFLQISSEKK